MRKRLFFARMGAAVVLLAAFMSLSLTVSSGGGGSADPVGRLFWEPDGEGGLWLCADPPLGELSGGAVALSMTLQFSDALSEEGSLGGDGWEITPCEGARGLTLTVGRASEGGDTRKILLDGYPTSTSGRLLRLRAADPLGEEGDVCSFGVKCLAVDGLYSMDRGGSIKKIPLSAEDFLSAWGDGTTGGETDTEMDVDTEADTETATETAAETATETAADTAEGLPTTPEEETLPPWVFLGCQETPVTDGVYGVRFLFYGETPVLCMEGGGALRGETSTVSLEGKAVSACTFRGLQEEGDYTFLVYTRRGRVEVKYRGGKFGGFFRQ